MEVHLGHHEARKVRVADRISALPDCLILHIFSFLPMKSVVSTGVLSKRWAHLWTEAPCLVFPRADDADDGYEYDSLDDDRYDSHDDDDGHVSHVDEYVSHVNSTLMLYRSSSIRKFCADFRYKKAFRSNVDRWVRFATSKNVEELELAFPGGYNSYPLPQHLYRNGSLRSLNLRGCNIKPNGLIEWRLLRSLSLLDAKLDNDVIQDILSGTPMLELFGLELCYGFDRVDASTASSNKLAMVLTFDSPSVAMEISGPNLKSLKIAGELLEIRFKNLSYLTALSLDCTLDSFQGRDEMMFIDILNSIRHVVEYLSIGMGCMAVLADHTSRGLLLPFLSKCKCLKLETNFGEWDLLGITRLLNSFPLLRNLHVKLGPVYSALVTRFSTADNLDVHRSQEIGCICLQRSLKIVTVTGDAELVDLGALLIRFLLNKGLALEKMIINMRKHGRTKQQLEHLLQVTQRLLTLPRSSPIAQVVLNV